MDILINGEPMESVLQPDPDSNLKSYIESLNEELGKINRVASVEQVESEPYQPTRHDVLPVGEIDRVNIRVLTIEKIAIDTLTDLGIYCQKYIGSLPDILNDWENIDSDQKDTYREQLVEALALAEDVLRSVQDMINLGESREQFESLLQRSIDLRSEFTESDQDELFSLLKFDGQQFFSELLSEIQLLLERLEQQQADLTDLESQIHATLNKQLESIPRLVEQIQTHGGSEEFDQIRDLTDDLDEIIDYIQLLDLTGKVKTVLEPEDQQELSKAHDELITGMDELAIALEDNDLVMISDILEYEVKPYLERIRDLLSELSPTG